MNRSCTIKVPGNPEWDYPVYKIIGQHSGPGTVIEEARRSPRNTGGSTDAGGGAEEEEEEESEEEEEEEEEDESFTRPLQDSLERYPEFINAVRKVVTPTIKQMRGYVRTMNNKMTSETVAELMARFHFNNHIHVFHVPQHDGIKRRGFRVDPRHGPVLVPVSYEDVKKIVKRSRKEKMCVVFYFSLDWMPSCQYIQDKLPEYVPDDPLLREYEGYPLFTMWSMKTQIQSLLELHDEDVEAAEESRKAREAEEREAARIAAEEARVARAVARAAAREAAQEAEAARIQAEEDAANQEGDPTPTPTPTRGDGT
eukprot:SAG11_NODE_9182_length_934_cov_15.792814_1_plen_311_part_11